MAQRSSAKAAAPSKTSTRTPARASALQKPLASYYLVLSTSALLICLGLVMVLSASSVRSYNANGSSFTIFERQLMWVLIGLPAMAVAMRIPARWWRGLGYPLLIVSAGLLVAVLVPGVGTRVSGATRWIDVGPVQLQPSEPAKLALALWGADLLVRKHKLLGDWKHVMLPLVPVAGFFALLVMIEPDMGTTMVLMLVLVTLLWIVGVPMRIFAGLLTLLAVLGGVLAVLEPYRLARLTSFLNPFADANNTGFQAVQGIYGLASGGWWGVGLGGSREKWVGLLPNAHTDFIFAIIGEELGLVGTMVVVLLFGLLAYAGIRIASRSPEPFVRLAAGAITAWLVGQAFINMATVVGLLPITGIPLPFISFGGTSLVLAMVCVGMLASFARTEPGAQAALAARRPILLRRWREGRQDRETLADVVTLPAGTRRTSARRPGSPARKPPPRGRPVRRPAPR